MRETRDTCIECFLVFLAHKPSSDSKHAYTRATARLVRPKLQFYPLGVDCSCASQPCSASSATVFYKAAVSSGIHRPSEDSGTLEWCYPTHLHRLLARWQVSLVNRTCIPPNFPLIDLVNNMHLIPSRWQIGVVNNMAPSLVPHPKYTATRVTNRPSEHGNNNDYL